MTEDVRLVLACAIALGLTAAATPAAIAAARRTAFYDHPTGYKQHASPTPYLGGVAVLVGLVAGSLVFGIGTGRLDIVLVAALALLAIGTVDDRFGLGIMPRLVAVLGAGAALYVAGVGFSLFGNEAADFVLTVAFVLGVVNAYNLMDNLDGAAPTVATVAAGGIGVYAMAAGDPVLAALGLGLAGACAGFLPYNLAAPRARIFLGDGGSMAIGVTLAAMMMSLPSVGQFGWELALVLIVLVGLPAFDTALVIFSRLRRGVAVLSGGRDHLSHRLLEQLESPRRVATALAAGQALCVALAIVLLQFAPAVAAAGAVVLCLAAISIIVAIDAPAMLSAALGALRGGPEAARDESPV